MKLLVILFALVVGGAAQAAPCGVGCGCAIDEPTVSTPPQAP